MEIRECMTHLLSLEWNGKYVWEGIRDKELTAASAFKGNLYDEASIKIMYVGHAFNGWEIDSSTCVSLDETVEFVINQDNGLNTLINRDGYPYIMKNDNEGKYFHINSRFFRLIKHILEYQNESDFPLSRDTWYDDSKKWNQKFVWSNLYNIAPRYGDNPDPKFIKLGMSQYTKLMKLQIEKYKPDIVIFLPLSGYFVPWKKQPSFDEILDSYNECFHNGPIIGEGKLGNTHIIVCKRPDVRGNSYEDVEKMAKIISDYIDKVCKK